MMRVFLDTNVLVAAVVGAHEHHVRALKVLDRVQTSKDQGHVAGHSLAEMYAILTKLPPPYRHTPEQALLSIEDNVLAHFKLTTLGPTEYGPVIRRAALSGVNGGTIYDLVLLECAAKSGAEKVWTFNLKHFQKVAPENLISQIFSP